MKPDPEQAPDDGPRLVLAPDGGGGDDGDRERWQRLQREMAGAVADAREVLRAPEAEPLDEVTRQLARLLWSFHDDEALWRALGRGEEQVERDPASLAAVLVDWGPLLEQVGYTGEPPAGAYAQQFRQAVAQALRQPDSVSLDDVRRRVKELATLLDRQAADQRPGRLAKKAAVLRASLPAAARIGFAAGVATAVGAGVAGITGPAGFIAGPAVTAGLKAFLDKVLPKVAEPELARVPFDQLRRQVLERLRFDELGAIEVGAELYCEIVAHDPADPMADQAWPPIREWLDRMLPTALVLWDAADGPAYEALTDHLRRMVDALSQLRGQLAKEQPDKDVVADVFDRLTESFSAVHHAIDHEVC